MSSLPKGESKGTKLVELFANRVVERRNMINVYLRGELALRVLGGVDSGGVYILSFYCSFRGFATFRAFYWSCGFSFFYMVFLSFSLAFGHLAVLYGVLDSRFKLCTFCCQ
jgi:hypothetical protein